MFGLRLLAVLALVAVNGFFVAAEFSLVAVRLSRVRQLVARGVIRAKIVLELLGDLDRALSGVQLGITLASLALGAVGEVTIARSIQAVLPAAQEGTRAYLLIHGVSLALSLAFLTLLHVVLGRTGPQIVEPGARRTCRLDGRDAAAVVPAHIQLGHLSVR